MQEIKSYKEWEQFAKGYTKVSIYLTDIDVFKMTPREKEMTLKNKIAQLFMEKGVEVFRYRHNYKKTDPKEYFGLCFHRTDSEITTTMEITALIGVNARYIGPAVG